jgi:hypothetical protein
MENDQNASVYQNRIQKLLERVNNIRSHSDEEKTTRIREIESAMESLLQYVQRIRETRSSHVDSFATKIQQLKSAFESEMAATAKVESKVEADLQNVTKLGVRLMEQAKLNRDQADKKLVSKLNNTIELIQAEIANSFSDKNCQSQRELDDVLRDELPVLHNELNNECQLRKELEGKIFEQFMGQIRELSELYDIEKKTREAKEEEIISVVNSISKEVEGAIRRQREERERSEENILELVEKVIDRLKRDISI